MSSIPVPPLIPSHAIFKDIQVTDIAKIEKIIGNCLTTLNTWKGAVKIGSTSNLVLSGEQTIDGVVCVQNDRVLVKDQTVPSENGLYTVDKDSWFRSEDLIKGSIASGAAVFVSEGTVNSDKVFVCTNDEASAVVGTDDLIFASITTIISAAGNDTEIQYNSGGSLAGNSALTFDQTTGTLTSTVLTDGTATLTTGALSGVTTLTATGAVQGGTVTDGTATMSAGNMTGVVNLSVSGETKLANTGTLGFFNKVPVSQQPAVTSPSTISAGYTQSEIESLRVSIEEIKTLLTNLGLTS
jgi:hypothetical protein